MQVPLLDLKAQYKTIREEILKVPEEVFESQYFILGPKVEALEKEISEYCHTKYAIGVSSGTDALLISWMGIVVIAINGFLYHFYTLMILSINLLVCYSINTEIYRYQSPHGKPVKVDYIIRR